MLQGDPNEGEHEPVCPPQGLLCEDALSAWEGQGPCDPGETAEGATIDSKMPVEARAKTTHQASTPTTARTGETSAGCIVAGSGTSDIVGVDAVVPRDGARRGSVVSDDGKLQKKKKKEYNGTYKNPIGFYI